MSDEGEEQLDKRNREKEIYYISDDDDDDDENDGDDEDEGIPGESDKYVTPAIFKYTNTHKHTNRINLYIVCFLWECFIFIVGQIRAESRW